MNYWLISCHVTKEQVVVYAENLDSAVRSAKKERSWYMGAFTRGTTSQVCNERMFDSVRACVECDRFNGYHTFYDCTPEKAHALFKEYATNTGCSISKAWTIRN